MSNSCINSGGRASAPATPKHEFSLLPGHLAAMVDVAHTESALKLMRIGVDASCWSNRRGYGRFTREILKSLLSLDHENEYWFFADRQTVASASDFPPNVHLVPVAIDVAPTTAASASGRRSIPDVWAMTNAVRKEDLDLFFFPAGYSYFPIVNRRIKIILTIHDMIPSEYSAAVFPNKKLAFFWKIKERMAIRQADLIVTVSQHARSQILKHTRIPAGRIRVISEAAEACFCVLPNEEGISFVLQKYRISEGSRFLLYAGGLNPHKNLERLLEAYAMLVRDSNMTDVLLVMVGDDRADSFYSNASALKKQAIDLNLSDRVIFAGFVEDRDLTILYNAATLFVFPSLQEGFGLPVLEAMNCGAPVAVSRAGSLPEIVGDAGLFFDPNNQNEMLSVIRNALTNENLRLDLKRRAVERSRHFDWNQSARMLLSVFDEMRSQGKNY